MVATRAARKPLREVTAGEPRRVPGGAMVPGMSEEAGEQASALLLWVSLPESV
jgi:hypothetical protein